MPSRTDLERRSNGSISVAIAVGAALISLLAVVAVNSKTSVVETDTVGGAGAPAVARLSLSEFKITPPTLSARAGLLSLEITNVGAMIHTLSIASLGKKTLDIAPGASATLDLGTVAAGTYPYQCDVPGHADSGMKGTLVVGGGSSSSGTTTAGAASGSTVQSALDNAQLEKDQTAGVTQFLDYAKKYLAGKVKTGNQPLKPTVLPDGTKEFDLTAAITKWEVSPGNVVKAWTYNGMVPGPWIRVEPGDKVKVVVKNKLPISTDVHLHGVDVPFEQDGVAAITQPYIKPGATYTYAFTASTQPKLGMYHAHLQGQEAIVNGLFAVFQVGDAPLPAGRSIAGVDVPAGLTAANVQEVPVVLNDAGVIGLSLNGRAFPETAPIVAKKGSWVLLQFFNEGLQGHPMHLHRQPQLVVAKDGYPLSAPYRVDTLWVAPGERYSVLVKAEDVGTWAFHCHIVSHAETVKGLAGMVTALIVQ